MVTPRELITVCRQIGGMMEAGVDILRITRVLRTQTENPRLLDLYDELDHDLTMGRGLADAMTRAPDVFSPFAISLVRQGEDRNNLGAAFLRLADFLQKEIETPSQSPHSVLPASDNSTASVTSISQDTAGIFAIEVLWQQVLQLGAAIALLWGLTGSVVAMGWLPAAWQLPLGLLLSAAVLWWGSRASKLNTELPAQNREPQVPPLNDWSEPNYVVREPDVAAVAAASAAVEPSTFSLEAPQETQWKNSPAEASLERLKQAPRRATEVEESFD
jgi:hypothetical protein